MSTEMRSCMDCGHTAPRSEFPPAHGRKAQAEGKRRRRCQPCWLKKRRETYVATDKARMYKWRYGITVEERDALLAAQGGACAICGTTDPGAKGDWCTDHDHACCPTKSRSCGKCIRGVLCFSCNIMLGVAKDDPAILAQGIDYLSESNVSRMTPI